MPVDFKKLQKEVEALDYKSHGLWDDSGKCILTHNMAKDPSNLPQIIKMLQVLPPGRYIINCSNGAGRKYAHFDFPVHIPAQNQNVSEIVPLSSAGSTQSPDIDPVEFGRLQMENEQLRSMLAQANEDDDDDDDEPAEPTLSEKVVEAVLPLAPVLAEKLLAVLDRWIAPAPLAEKPQEQPQQIVLSPEAVQQIAAQVKDMILAETAKTYDNAGY